MSKDNIKPRCHQRPRARRDRAREMSTIARHAVGNLATKMLTG